MPEPFKNFFSEALIEGMADHLTRAGDRVGAGGFNRERFVAQAKDGLQDLELKARSAQIAQALVAALPDEFSLAAEVIRRSLHPRAGLEAAIAEMDGEGIRGWGVMPMTEWVALRGGEHFDEAMELLRDMTSLFSAEFAIRTFILADTKRALRTLERWADDPNHHVRRLVTEGTRPRLPWAIRLPPFIEDPTAALALLKRLRDDESEYVRRSVANHLNDIAKDHPDLVADVARDWLVDAPPERQRLVRHACRSLLKDGHPGAMAALGYEPPRLALQLLVVRTPTVPMGGALEFEIEIVSESERSQRLMLDYVIHHRKANGSTSPKVFKWKTLVLPGRSEHRAKRRHPIRPITTRRYYAGTHFVEIQINGQSFGRAAFELEA